MSARCVNPKCPGEIKEGWSFCSKCGQDNRPPFGRFTILDCEHQIELGEFCVRCGVSTIDAHEPDNPESHWFEWMGWALILGGALLLIFTQIQLRGAGALEKGSVEHGKAMRDAYSSGRLAFYMLPAGAIFVVFLGRRWKVFKR